MPLTIRFATETDFDLVRSIDPHAQNIDPDRIRRKIQGAEILLAYADGEPVGLIRFSYFWSTRPYLDLIWFQPHARGKGYGTQLLHFLEQYLVRQGHTHLLSSSQENEPGPQQWHKNQGFTFCGELKGINLPQEETSEYFYIKSLVPR
ncbi:MAG: GNAT family N-acetyltransferase [Patescibacteria group bacterium]